MSEPVYKQKPVGVPGHRQIVKTQFRTEHLVILLPPEPIAVVNVGAAFKFVTRQTCDCGTANPQTAIVTYAVFCCYWVKQDATNIGIGE